MCSGHVTVPVCAFRTFHWLCRTRIRDGVRDVMCQSRWPSACTMPLHTLQPCLVPRRRGRWNGTHIEKGLRSKCAFSCSGPAGEKLGVPKSSGVFSVYSTYTGAAPWQAWHPIAMTAMPNKVYSCPTQQRPCCKFKWKFEQLDKNGVTPPKTENFAASNSFTIKGFWE